MKPPLKPLLGRSEPDGAALDRVWAQVRARERRRRSPVRGALALAAAVVLLGGGAAAWRQREVALVGTASPAEGLVLTAEPGAVASWRRRDGRVELRVERGQVRVAARTGVACLVTARTLRVEVAAATARFEVGEGELVSVEEGEVVVRSQRVRAGARYATPSTAWRAAAAAGDLAGAWAALGPEGARREAQTGSAEVRTLLADIAAAGEDLPLAVSLLEEVVASAAPAAERAVAAYDLGLRLLEQGRPARAAGSFEEALALGLPATLTPDARARAAESWLKAGDAGRARRWLEAVEQTP